MIGHLPRRDALREPRSAPPVYALRAVRRLRLWNMAESGDLPWANLAISSSTRAGVLGAVGMTNQDHPARESHGACPLPPKGCWSFGMDFSRATARSKCSQAAFQGRSRPC